jgi:hypothetical protein
MNVRSELRNSLVEFILQHNSKLTKRELEQLTVEALMVIKIQAEIENERSSKQHCAK